MFTDEIIAEHKKEIEVAKTTRQARAAFGSIVRRNAEEFGGMSASERALWLAEIQAPPSYMTEIAKELSIYQYDEEVRQ